MNHIKCLSVFRQHLKWCPLLYNHIEHFPFFIYFFKWQCFFCSQDFYFVLSCFCSRLNLYFCINLMTFVSSNSIRSTSLETQSSKYTNLSFPVLAQFLCPFLTHFYFEEFGLFNNFTITFWLGISRDTLNSKVQTKL